MQTLVTCILADVDVSTSKGDSGSPIISTVDGQVHRDAYGRLFLFAWRYGREHDGRRRHRGVRRV